MSDETGGQSSSALRGAVRDRVTATGDLVYRAISGFNRHACGITTVQAVYCRGEGGGVLGDGKRTRLSLAPVRAELPTSP
jgi:hypothetical protein